MKPHLDFLGKRIYLAGEVVVSGFSYPKIYFKIQDKYEIFYTINKFTFSDCTCQHGSFWGINEEDKCKHTAAVRWWIREELQSFISQSNMECQTGNDDRVDNYHSHDSIKDPIGDTIINPQCLCSTPIVIPLREQDSRNNSIIEEVSVPTILPENMEDSESNGEDSEPIPFWIQKYLDKNKEERP